MSKIGVEIRIDVTKIEKQRIYNGQKGKYLTMTAFIDPDNEDQYGNHGMVTHSKNEGEDRAPILGNAKVFWRDNQGNGQQNTNTNAPAQGRGGAVPYQQHANAQGAVQSHSSQPSGDQFDKDFPF